MRGITLDRELGRRNVYVLSVTLSFIRPCSPTTAKSLPAGDAWLHEPKLDGYRLQVVKEGR
jgi:ATP-dependent DNA ligase